VIPIVRFSGEVPGEFVESLPTRRVRRPKEDASSICLSSAGEIYRHMCIGMSKETNLWHNKGMRQLSQPGLIHFLCETEGDSATKDVPRTLSFTSRAGVREKSYCLLNAVPLYTLTPWHLL
jgi:hypothetical protein